MRLQVLDNNAQGQLSTTLVNSESWTILPTARATAVGLDLIKSPIESPAGLIGQNYFDRFDENIFI
jgi:hypothetical protein